MAVSSYFILSRCFITLRAGPSSARVWNLRSQKLHNVPEQTCEQRGQVVSVAWVTRQHEKCETLCYSTGLGYLVFWNQKRENVSMDFNLGMYKHLLVPRDLSKNCAPSKLQTEKSLLWPGISPMKGIASELPSEFGWECRFGRSVPTDN